ncbi:MAG: LysE family transporter [Microlunatus sp.]
MSQATPAESQLGSVALTALASITWFTGLGFGARLLAPVFANPTAWRIFDIIVALVMTAIAVKLVVGLFQA